VSLSQREQYRVIVMGDTNTGKTQLVNRYISGQFNSQGANDKAVQFNLCRTASADLRVFDIPGLAAYKNSDQVALFLTKGANAYIITYDLTNSASFAEAREWLEKAQKEADDKAVFFIVGTKLDRISPLTPPATRLQEVVSYVESGSIQTPVFYHAISAATNIGVTELFEAVASAIVARTRPRLLQGPSDLGTFAYSAETTRQDYIASAITDVSQFPHK